MAGENTAPQETARNREKCRLGHCGSRDQLSRHYSALLHLLKETRHRTGTRATIHLFGEIHQTVSTISASIPESGEAGSGRQTVCAFRQRRDFAPGWRRFQDFEGGAVLPYAPPEKDWKMRRTGVKALCRNAQTASSSDNEMQPVHHQRHAESSAI
jgi:hypothetical protein